MVDVSRVRVDFLVSEDFLKRTPRKIHMEPENTSPGSLGSMRAALRV